MTTPSAQNIAVAFDFATREECTSLLEKLSPELRLAKIGSVLFTKYGPEILAPFVDRGVEIFLDLKFHDIPNTVMKSVAHALAHGPIAMLTIHASGGAEMIRRAREAADAASGGKTKVLAVTVLTSLDDDDLARLGFACDDVGDQVDRLARLAAESGAHGVVCSPREIARVRDQVFRDTLLVVPGIRGGGDAAGDQVRTASAAEAFAAGADRIVVGRPIYGAADPRAAFQSLIAGAPR